MPKELEIHWSHLKDRFWLMPNFFSTPCNREKFNTSFEIPNLELLELGKKLGVVSL